MVPVFVCPQEFGVDVHAFPKFAGSGGGGGCLGVEQDHLNTGDRPGPSPHVQFSVLVVVAPQAFGRDVEVTDGVRGADGSP